METNKENENRIELFISKNGAEYSVSSEENEAQIEPVDALNATKHMVDWVADSQWHDTDSTTYEVTKIKRYKIDTHNKGIFNNKLYFENAAHYCYYFEDRTGDVYKNNTYFNKVHTIGYNSSDPRIVSITAVKY